MTLQTAKKTLDLAIKNQESVVIALSGNWGSGKSHLWKQYQLNSNEPSIKNSIYISLFGVRTIKDLKVKLLSACIEKEGREKISNAITETLTGIGKLIKGIHRSAEAIDNIALLAIPRILREKFIVLDDIERKHKNLEIEEILGFIDEFSSIHKNRFLLILNTDKLRDKNIWEEFQEKVISNEIAIEPTATESLEIALSSAPSPYANAIKKAGHTIGITNIRILIKQLI